MRPLENMAAKYHAACRDAVTVTAHWAGNSALKKRGGLLWIKFRRAVAMNNCLKLGGIIVKLVMVASYVAFRLCSGWLSGAVDRLFCGRRDERLVRVLRPASVRDLRFPSAANSRNSLLATKIAGEPPSLVALLLPALPAALICRTNAELFHRA
jgi:hypothetical protein